MRVYITAVEVDTVDVRVVGGPARLLTGGIGVRGKIIFPDNIVLTLERAELLPDEEAEVRALYDRIGARLSAQLAPK